MSVWAAQGACRAAVRAASQLLTHPFTSPSPLCVTHPVCAQWAWLAASRLADFEAGYESCAPSGSIPQVMPDDLMRLNCVALPNGPSHTTRAWSIVIRVLVGAICGAMSSVARAHHRRPCAARTSRATQPPHALPGALIVACHAVYSAAVPCMPGVS